MIEAKMPTASSAEPAPTPTIERVPVGSALYNHILEFLFEEAALLDHPPAESNQRSVVDRFGQIVRRAGRAEVGLDLEVDRAVDLERSIEGALRPHAIGIQRAGAVHRCRQDKTSAEKRFKSHGVIRPPAPRLMDVKAIAVGRLDGGIFPEVARLSHPIESRSRA